MSYGKIKENSLDQFSKMRNPFRCGNSSKGIVEVTLQLGPLLGPIVQLRLLAIFKIFRLHIRT